MRLAPRLTALALVATAALAGCGDGEGGPGGGPSNEITISGSSTVEPISTRVAELFEDREADVAVHVDGPGTGDGFQLFCNGETDISDASRPIEQAEVATCDGNGVDFVELQVAFDGISVLTHPDNPIACLTFADLYALVGPESEDVDRWSDASELAAELGSTTELPDEPLTIIGPGEESGTYDSFVELVLADIAEVRAEEGHITAEQAETTRPNYQSSPDDNTIIQGVEGSPSSLGWVGFAFASEAEGVRSIAVDGGDGCVEDTPATIADGSYPISRPLFIYVSLESLDTNPSVADFVDFYLHDGLGAVEEVGYVPLDDDQLADSRLAFEQRLTGPRTSPE